MTATKTKATHATDPNPQAPKAQEDGQTTQQAGTAAAPAAAGTASAVAPAQAPSAPIPPDENHGRGGHYVRMKDGRRVLLARTLSETEHAQAEAAKAQAQ